MAVLETVFNERCFFSLLCYTKPSFILFWSVLIRVTVRELLDIFVLLTKCSPRCSWTCHKILDESRKPSGYPAKLRDIRLSGQVVYTGDDAG